MNDLQRKHAHGRLLNTILFFAHRTPDLGKMKLLKLLWFTDQRHILETGLALTGQEYITQKNGPVPREFFQKWPDSVHAVADIVKEHVPGKANLREKIEPLSEYDPEVFSPFQIELLEEIVRELGHMNGTELAKLSHDGTDPEIPTAWRRALSGTVVFPDSGEFGQLITLENILQDSECADQIMNLLAEAGCVVRA